MASLSVDEVRQLVLEEEEIDENEVVSSEDLSLVDKIQLWIDSFPASDGFKWDLFRELSMEMMKPIVSHCSVSSDYGELQANERSRAASSLCTSFLNSGSIIQTEALLWLDKIHSRLGGRVAFRQPYHATVSRCIPFEVFKVIRRAVENNNSGSFSEPRCYIKQNNRIEVIAFTSLYSFHKFMSMISGKSIAEVKQYLNRTLKGRCREGHKVKLLVEEEKQLALTYTIRRGQLTISFDYGEWNTVNYPKHNCKFDPDSLK